ncbi:MAG: hypothetical protein F4Y61_08345 [Rhodothermaceae bacterium]|nr:hypothetical protein [Rhodothermaceae bacterium]
MIPELIEIARSPWPILPAGIHRADFAAVERRFASNKKRRELFGGLIEASRILNRAGCQHLFLDGSFVTKKPIPNDYDVCWDPHGVDRQLMDPVFFDFRNNRAAQKERFGGEFFPSTSQASPFGPSFLEFFQIEKSSGKQKGIIKVQLDADSLLS